MIRRLIEGDIYKASDDPSMEKVCFWFSECRTSELLISLAAKYPEKASRSALSRPLIKQAIEGNKKEIQKLLRDEEERERESDRQYWEPLKAELKAWRHKIS